MQQSSILTHSCMIDTPVSFVSIALILCMLRSVCLTNQSHGFLHLLQHFIFDFLASKVGSYYETYAENKPDGALSLAISLIQTTLELPSFREQYHMEWSTKYSDGNIGTFLERVLRVCFFLYASFCHHFTLSWCLEIYSRADHWMDSIGKTSDTTNTHSFRPRLFIISVYSHFECDTASEYHAAYQLSSVALGVIDAVSTDADSFSYSFPLFRLYLPAPCKQQKHPSDQLPQLRSFGIIHRWSLLPVPIG